MQKTSRVEVRPGEFPELQDLIEWVANFYNLTRVVITVVSAKRTEDFSAQCHLTRRTKKRTYYTLRLNTAIIEEWQHSLPKLIIHEMTHVKQYEQDGLDHVSGNKYLWRGQAVWANEDNYYEYIDSPWEQDARLAEDKLWYLYRKHVLGANI